MSSRGSAWSDCRDSGPHFNMGRADILEQLEGATRNKSIFTSISEILKENGYDCDWLQCRAKIKKVESRLQVKDYNGGTGKNRKTCKFFGKLDAIVGHKPASAPSVVLDAGSSNTAADEPTSQDGAERETGNGDGKQ